MNTDTMIRAGAVLGGLGIAAGAFGAHFLAGYLSAPDLANYETGVRYQIYHALALLSCAALAERRMPQAIAAHCFWWGTLVFSGSLYVLVLTGQRWLGAITPIGGTLLVVGWVALLLSTLKGRGAPPRAP